MVDCLLDAGIPADLSPLDGTQYKVELTTDESFYVCSSAGCMLSVARNVRASESQVEALESKYQAMQARYGEDEGALYLFVGDADLTDAYRSCIDETGYVDPTIAIDPGQQAHDLEMQFEATLAWVECARENGMPLLDDPHRPSVGQEVTQGSAVVLPLTTDLVALRGVLAECPASGQDEAVDGSGSAGWAPAITVEAPVVEEDFSKWEALSDLLAGISDETTKDD
ncbi:MAG: hypothetical protein LBH68_00715 [Bifidobacteriaceae bacterium]|jgi:hypothetical protein|nr:hypothetical protein [Bifidobacteriaceae bacterium]